MELSRRDLIKMGLIGSAALYLPVERLVRAADQVSLAKLPTPFTYPFVTPPSIDLRGRGAGANVQLTMRQVSASLLGGGTSTAFPNTPLWAYTGPNGEVNPTIHVDKGQPVSISHVNGLPATHPVHGYESWTSVHLHGSASKPQFDGYANDVTTPGQRKTYEYPNAQGARTLWYHDHGVHRTAKNAYAGLAGQYHLHDQMEKDSGIPTGAYDEPLTIRDALFTREGTLLWNDNGQSSLMGDVILVNGVPWPVKKVLKRMYRFRILNASISRSLKLSLSDPSGKAKMYVIATDGGFLPAPVQVSNIRVGMAERYEIVVDFSLVPDNTKITLQSAEVKNNVDYLHTRKIMRFDVQPGTAVPKAPGNMLPTAFYTPRTPTPGYGYMGPDEVMGLDLNGTRNFKTRHFRLKKSDATGEWMIDDATWNEIVASDYNKTLADVKLGDTEIWEWENSSGGWFHPLHIHLVDFKILSRSGGTALQPYEKGPKDVVYVGEGETVRLLMKFGPHCGRYMVHCHNLVHEDHDMMSQFRVVSPDKDTWPEYDPMNDAKPY